MFRGVPPSDYWTREYVSLYDCDENNFKSYQCQLQSNLIFEAIISSQPHSHDVIGGAPAAQVTDVYPHINIYMK